MKSPVNDMIAKDDKPSNKFRTIKSPEPLRKNRVPYQTVSEVGGGDRFRKPKDTSKKRKSNSKGGTIIKLY